MIVLQRMERGSKTTSGRKQETPKKSSKMVIMMMMIISIMIMKMTKITITQTISKLFMQICKVVSTYSTYRFITI